LHKARAGASQPKESFACFSTTNHRAASCKLVQAGASKDGPQNLPRWATQRETSLHIMAASGNGLQPCSRSMSDSSRRSSTRVIGKPPASPPATQPKLLTSFALRSADFFDNKHHVVVSTSCSITRPFAHQLIARRLLRHTATNRPTSFPTQLLPTQLPLRMDRRESSL
jgi:hypothetical protein